MRHAAMPNVCPNCYHLKSLHVVTHPLPGGGGCTQAQVGECHPVECCGCGLVFTFECPSCHAVLDGPREPGFFRCKPCGAVFQLPG